MITNKSNVVRLGQSKIWPIKNVSTSWFEYHLGIRLKLFFEKFFGDKFFQNRGVSFSHVLLKLKPHHVDLEVFLHDSKLYDFFGSRPSRKVLFRTTGKKFSKKTRVSFLKKFKKKLKIRQRYSKIAILKKIRKAIFRKSGSKKIFKISKIFTKNRNFKKRFISSRKIAKGVYRLLNRKRYGRFYYLNPTPKRQKKARLANYLLFRRKSKFTSFVDKKKRYRKRQLRRWKLNRKFPFKRRLRRLRSRFYKSQLLPRIKKRQKLARIKKRITKKKIRKPSSVARKFSILNKSKVKPKRLRSKRRRWRHKFKKFKKKYGKYGKPWYNKPKNFSKKVYPKLSNRSRSISKRNKHTSRKHDRRSKYNKGSRRRRRRMRISPIFETTRRSVRFLFYNQYSAYASKRFIRYSFYHFLAKFLSAQIYKTFKVPVKVKFNFFPLHRANSNFFLNYITTKLYYRYILADVIKPIVRMSLKFYRGFVIHCKGRFTRAQIAVSKKFVRRSVSYSRSAATLDYGQRPVILKYGTCNLRIWIRK